MSNDAADSPDGPDPSDVLALDSLLTPEELALRRADPRLHGPADPPGHRPLVRRRRLSAGPRPGTGRTRRAGHAPGGLRLPGPLRRRIRPGGHGAGGRRFRHPHVRLRAGLPGHDRHPQVGLRGPEAGVAPPDGRRRGDRLLRPDRAHGRLGPVVDDHRRPPRRHGRRRRLDAGRRQALDRARLRGRGDGGLGQDRRRRPRLPRAGRHRRASPRRRSGRNSRCAPRSSAT